METVLLYRGCIGIMEKKMETILTDTTEELQVFRRIRKTSRTPRLERDFPSRRGPLPKSSRSCLFAGGRMDL